MTRSRVVAAAALSLLGWLPQTAFADGTPADSDTAATAEASMTFDKATADSCAAAFATVMADYLRPELNSQFGADSVARREFVEGVAHAFEIKNAHAPYFFGVRSGLAMIDRVEGMTGMGFPMTTDSFLAAFGEAMDGNTMGFDADSADAFLRTLMERMYERDKPAPLTEESQAAFLEAQKSRPGVIETPSGLLFEVITEGEGEHPRPEDSVKVLYTGKLADGTVFDETDRPVMFPVSRLVAGFTEGLQLMKPGGKYRLFIPASLGYGDKGAGGGVIPGNAALDFTVELLEIMK